MSPFSVASSITHAAINLVEAGCVPDSVTRMGIRKMLRSRLVRLEQEEQSKTSTRSMHEFCNRSPIAAVPDLANDQHYEIPAEFYEHVLGPRRKYSCCYFEANDSLEQAEIKSLERTCENAQLQDGMRILELGCGWGSLTLWMAEKFPNSTIVAVSNSKSQREFIESKAKLAGSNNRVEVVTADMNEFNTEQRFDRVVSVEMFEHMRNYERLLSNVNDWLLPSGKLFIHIFCHHKFAYPFETQGAANWMGRYFFSGGIMPSVDLMASFDEHLKISRQWTWSGTHYEKTCRAWKEQMKAGRESVMPVLERVYGSEAKKWWHRWLLFFEAGAELFGFDEGNEWQVVHLLFDRCASHKSSKLSLQKIKA